MNWRPQTNPYYLRSECGAYSVVKIGSATGWTYEACHMREQIEVGLASADEAKQVCMDHSERLKREKAA